VNVSRRLVSPTWFEITLALARERLDAATSVLADLGHAGSELVEREGAPSEIRVYVQCDDESDARLRANDLSRALVHLDPEGTSVRALDEQVWRDGWKRHFARTRIGRRLEILPPWEADSPTPGAIALVINPGMAFGTGQHETTAGCLELLEDLVSQGDAVLDVGCGSGILAIAAIKLGAANVLAIDNDPEALNATRENIVMNRVAESVVCVLRDGPPAVERTFNVAVANVLAEPLAEMAAELTSCVKEDGALILSGIESERRPLVESAYGHQGWRVTRDIDRSGWVSLAMRKHHAHEDDGARQ
jgi:ribosomal protein L11 methyltransferase